MRPGWIGQLLDLTLTTLQLNFPNAYLTTTVKAGKRFAKKQRPDPVILLPGNKGGHRAHAKIKASALVTIAIQRQQIQRDAGKQKNHEHNDFPKIKDRFLKLDGLFPPFVNAFTEGQRQHPIPNESCVYATPSTLNKIVTSQPCACSAAHIA